MVARAARKILCEVKRFSSVACHACDLARQADLNAPDGQGLRPIHMAAKGGMLEAVQALIAAGVVVDAMGAEGNTALHLASFHGQDGVVALLMAAGTVCFEEPGTVGWTCFGGEVSLSSPDADANLLAGVCPLHVQRPCPLRGAQCTVARTSCTASTSMITIANGCWFPSRYPWIAGKVLVILRGSTGMMPCEQGDLPPVRIFLGSISRILR